MEKGLYKKLSSEEMIFAKNEISYPDGTVISYGDHVDATGEIYDGWYWFNSRNEAKAALGVIEPSIPEMFNTTAR